MKLKNNVSKKNGLSIMGLFFALLIVLAYSGFSWSVIVVLLTTLVAIGFSSRHLAIEDRAQARLLLITTFTVYCISAVFFSITFEGGKAFVTPDALQYFSHLKMTSLDMDPMVSIVTCYGLLSDNNEMHELFVRYCILFANNYLDGASVIYLTLINVLFGVLTIGTVFRILLKTTSSHKAFKYALFFALLSPFHFYSVAFVRDILVAFFYAYTIEIILSKFKVGNVFLLFIFVILVWGIRLYSGLFILFFIAYYFLQKILESRATSSAIVVLFFSVLIVSFVFSQLRVTDILTQSMEEIQNYQEYNADRASTASLSMKLESLPPVIREVSLIAFAQIMPFPPYIGTIDMASTIPEFYTAVLTCIYEIYWYFIAFGLLYMLILKKCFSQLTVGDKLLIIIILSYIYLNTSQIDVRRVMAIYPLILFLYVKCRELFLAGRNQLVMNRTLGLAYFALIIIYTLLK